MDNSLVPIICYLFSLRIYYYQIWSGQYQLFNGHAYDPSSCRIANWIVSCMASLLQFSLSLSFLFHFCRWVHFLGVFFSGHPMLTMCPLFQLLLLNSIVTDWHGNVIWIQNLNFKFMKLKYCLVICEPLKMFEVLRWESITKRECIFIRGREMEEKEIYGGRFW